MVFEMAGFEERDLEDCRVVVEGVEIDYGVVEEGEFGKLLCR